MNFYITTSGKCSCEALATSVSVHRLRTGSCRNSFAQHVRTTIFQKYPVETRMHTTSERQYS